LLVMLRAILYTRISGDAGMKRQRLALVPVGAVGVEELLSLMSQYVVSFINEADIYVRRGANRELKSRVATPAPTRTSYSRAFGCTPSPNGVPTASLSYGMRRPETSPHR